MENASKALIMAGSILIAIIIISLGVVIFKNMANSARNSTTLDRQAITRFNSQISPYLGENVSGSKVNELIQLVRTINQKAKVENNNDSDNTGKISINGKYENIERVKSGGVFYKVEGKYDDSGLLTIITYEEHPKT